MLATASNPARMRELGVAAQLNRTLVYDIPTSIESPLRHFGRDFGFRGEYGARRGRVPRVPRVPRVYGIRRRRGSWTLIILSFVSKPDWWIILDDFPEFS